MADKRLVEFGSKPIVEGSDITYVGDSSDLFREVKTTIDQFNSYSPYFETSASQNVAQSFFGKNIVSNSAAPIVLTIPFGAGFPITSQFEMIRNTAGAFTLTAAAGVTINGVDGDSVVLSQQYDRLVATNVGTNSWAVIEYSQTAGNVTLQDTYDASAPATITYTAGKSLQLNAIGTDDAIGCTTTTNTSGTNNFSIYTTLPDATAGLEYSEAVFTTLVAGAPTDFMSRKSTECIQFDSKRLNIFKTTGAPSGIYYETTLGQVPQVTHNIMYEGIDATLAVSRFAQRQVEVISSGVTSSAILRDNVSEASSPETTTIYQELDGSTRTIRQFKPVEIANLTAAELAALTLPAKGLVAYVSDSDRLSVQKGTPGVPVYDSLAYISDIPTPQAPSYGEMYFNDNATETVIVSPATPVKVAGTYVSGLISEFTHSAGTMTYIGSGDTFKLNVSLSCTLNLASGTVSVIIYQNGSPISKSKQESFLGSTSPGAQNISCMALVSLATNDTVEIFIQNDSGSENITVTQLNCIPEELAGGAGSGGQVVTSWDGSITPVDVTAGTDIDISAGVISYTGTPASGVVTSWNGSTTPVAVTAGANVNIAGGVISVPDYSASAIDTFISSSSGFSNIQNRGNFTIKSGLVTQIYKDIDCELLTYTPWVEFELLFISAFSNPREVSGTCEVINAFGAGGVYGGSVSSFVPIIGTNRVRFTFDINTTPSLPNPFTFRFNFCYSNFPL
jgi:hypothetical protein